MYQLQNISQLHKTSSSGINVSDVVR